MNRALEQIVSEALALIKKALEPVAQDKINNKTANEVESKLHKFQWFSLKVRSALEESQKYDIDNKPLREMQQVYVAGVQEAEEVLNELLDIVKPSIAPPGSTTDDRSLDIRTAKLDLYFKALHNISESLVKALRSISLRDLMVCTRRLFGQKCSDDEGNNFLARLKKIEKLNRTLDKLEVMSNDVGNFLEMVSSRNESERGGEGTGRTKPSSCRYTLNWPGMYWVITVVELKSRGWDLCFQRWPLVPSLPEESLPSDALHTCSAEIDGELIVDPNRKSP